MTPITFSLRYDSDRGLTLHWPAAWASPLPLRVHLRGTHTFSVWGVVDSGEAPPAWAQPGLDIMFFGPDNGGVAPMVVTIEHTDGIPAWRARATHERAAATLDVRLEDGRLRVALAIENPAPPTGPALPIGSVELRLEGLRAGDDGEYWGSHAYGGRTHSHGRLAAIEAPGLPFVHGCIGQALPVLYLHSPTADGGLEFEYMLGQRPIAWLRPPAGLRPAQNSAVDFTVFWSTERLLEPGETHVYPGALAMTPYQGPAIAALRRWRDTAASRYGLVSPPTPEWARRANIIEFNMNPDNSGHPFQRLDDPRCRDLLASWQAMGYNAIFAVSCNNVGQNWLSPFDYEPSAAVGGAAAERQMLAWAHELGFHIFLWVTTVGVDRASPLVRDHADWFTHRPDGSPFYAWDSHPPDYVGYAPDADPLSSGWRAWFKAQVHGVVARGYDGIFVDGCIPRASNHARWAWPGQGRNGVEEQVVDLARFVRGLGPGLITFVEDESLLIQATCEVTVGRYVTAPPVVKKAFWDHGMGGGPEVKMAPPAPVEPEHARDYLAVRYGSLLPGVVSNDVVEGYISEAARPWAVQSIVCGAVPKTHSQYVDDPATYRAQDGAPAPGDADRAPAHRLRGHAEFVALLKLCRDDGLLRDAPLSFDGVVVEGDAAVVGILRPTAGRCLLALIQFADHPASVTIRVAPPDDVPAVQRAAAGAPHQTAWRARELLHSLAEDAACPAARVSGTQPMTVTLGPYGFRIFELLPG